MDLPVEVLCDFFDRIHPRDMWEYYTFNSSEELRDIWIKYLRKSEVLYWKLNPELPKASVMREVTAANKIKSLYLSGTIGVLSA